METQLQELKGQLQVSESRCKKLEGELRLAQVSESRLQGFESQLQVSESSKNKLETQLQDLKDKYRNLESEFTELKAKYNQWIGQIEPLRVLSSKWAKFFIAVMIIIFDGFAISEILEDKLGVLAYILAAGLCFSLLSFTASENRRGRDLAIGVAFVAASLYFDLIGSTKNVVSSVFSGNMPDTVHLTHLFFSFIPAIITFILTDDLHPGLRNAPSIFKGWSFIGWFKKVSLAVKELKNG